MIKNKPLVLVAEDDPDDRLLLEEALKPFTDLLQLSFIEDGEKLMECLNHEGRYRDPAQPRPQLLLLNFNMPKKDGIQALMEIKQDAKLRHIPVIIWTTSSIEEERRICIDAGAEDYLTKPSTFAELESTVRGMVKRWIYRPVTRNALGTQTTESLGEAW